MVLDVDPTKRRISLGLKQCTSNPWTDYVEKNTVGSVVEGEIKNITEFGLFVGLTEELDGMVHLSDLDWVKSGEQAIAEYQKGDQIKVQILDIDVEKERISLGVKQLSEDPVQGGLDKLKKGDVVTCTISAISDKGVDVMVGEELPGFIRRSDLSQDRSEQRPDRFAKGDLVDAKITNIDKATRRLTLSVKAREVAEEKAAMAEYGSSDSGASLGDILGAALREKSEAEANESGDDAAEDAATAPAEAAAEPGLESPALEATEDSAEAAPEEAPVEAPKEAQKEAPEETPVEEPSNDETPAEAAPEAADAPAEEAGAATPAKKPAKRKAAASAKSKAKAKAPAKAAAKKKTASKAKAKTED